MTRLWPWFVGLFVDFDELNAYIDRMAGEVFGGH